MEASPIVPTRFLVAQAPISRYTVVLSVNKQENRTELEAWATLPNSLRDRLRPTGTKKGCEHCQCDACTVQFDGKRINNCLTLSVMHNCRMNLAQ